MSTVSKRPASSAAGHPPPATGPNERAPSAFGIRPSTGALIAEQDDIARPRSLLSPGTPWGPANEPVPPPSPDFWRDKPYCSPDVPLPSPTPPSKPWDSSDAAASASSAARTRPRPPPPLGGS
jgi:hypothetical protein